MHHVPLVAEEERERVLRRVAADGVDRLVHHAQDELRARRRLAVGAGDLHAVLRRLAGPVLRLVGGDVHVQLVADRRHLDVLRALVHHAFAQILRADPDAGLVLRRHRHFEDRGGVGRAHHACNCADRGPSMETSTGVFAFPVTISTFAVSPAAIRLLVGDDLHRLAIAARRNRSRAAPATHRYVNCSTSRPSGVRALTRSR